MQFLQKISPCSSVGSSRSCRGISAQPWTSQGCRGMAASPCSAPWPAGESLLQHLEHLLPLLPHCSGLCRAGSHSFFIAPHMAVKHFGLSGSCYPRGDTPLAAVLSCFLQVSWHWLELTLSSSIQCSGPPSIPSTSSALPGTQHGPTDTRQPSAPGQQQSELGPQQGLGDDCSLTWALGAGPGHSISSCQS